MKKIFFLLLFIQGFGFMVSAQVGIGTSTPSTNAILDLKSSTKGLLLPRTSTTTRMTIPNTKGLMIYDSTMSQIFYNQGFGWYNLLTGHNHWSVSQIDANDIFNNNTGNVGIGTSNDVPYKFSVFGTLYAFDTPKTTVRLGGIPSTTEARVLFDLPSNTMDYNITQFENRLYFGRTLGQSGISNDIVIDPQLGYVGIGVGVPQTRLSVNGGTDVGSASGGYLQLGLENALNIGIDNNEIQARNNGVVYRLHLNASGGTVQVGNAIAPASYSLAVDGKIICEELKIQASANWADYVFADDYSLRSLDELQKFINVHHHLPNIPDADTIEKNGIVVGDMQKRMMEKIEELTLYILQLEEKNKEQDKQIELLRSDRL